MHRPNIDDYPAKVNADREKAGISEDRFTPDTGQ